MVPTGCSALLRWSTNFGACIEDPAYQIAAPKRAAYDELQAIYATAQNAVIAAREGKCYSGPIYAGRDTAKANLLVIARELHAYVKANRSISNELKQAAGVTVSSVGRTPVQVPGSAPVLEFIEARSNRIELRLLKAAGVPGGSKPVGARTASVFTSIGPVAPPPDGAWVWQGNTGKTTMTIVLPASEEARKVWVTAAWCNAKGQAGECCRPQSIEIAPAGALPTAMKIAA